MPTVKIGLILIASFVKGAIKICNLYKKSISKVSFNFFDPLFRHCLQGNKQITWSSNGGLALRFCFIVFLFSSSFSVGQSQKITSKIKVGAEQTEQYLKVIKGKKVAIKLL